MLKEEEGRGGAVSGRGSKEIIMKEEEVEEERHGEK